MSEMVFMIGDREVGTDRPCLIVAELSANHNQSLARAIAIVGEAKKAGADAVKLQTYTPDTLTIECDREWFQVPDSSLWRGKTLYELYSEAFTPWEWHAELARVAREEGLLWFSTPFDDTAVTFLESLDTPAHKVASFEVVDLPLLESIGRTGKPVIMSTGMASLDEITAAVKALRDAGTRDLALLKCTSAYPATPKAMNLRTMMDLRDRFRVVAGLSDHTMGASIAVAAVALGAAIIEKHFTVDRADSGPDSSFSMEPAEFAAMVRDIRHAEQALGNVSYERTPEEEANVRFRKSLFVVKDTREGEAFTLDNVRSIRPGQGLPPADLSRVLGKLAACDIDRGTPLEWGHVAD